MRVMTNRVAVWSALLVMVAPLFGWSAPQQRPRTSASEGGVRTASRSLTYVANAGVLVTAGETKILIDALFDKPAPAYRAPSLDQITVRLIVQAVLTARRVDPRIRVQRP